MFSKTLRVLVAAALAAASLVAVSAAPAHATDTTAFDCTPDFYQASNGSFYHLDTNTFRYALLGSSTISSSMPSVGTLQTTTSTDSPAAVTQRR